MSMPLPTGPGASSSALLDCLAGCIDALGSDDFEASLLVLLGATFGIEQCMIFALDRDDRLECLLASNERQPLLARRLAQRYAEGLYRLDPNYSTLRRLATEEARGATLAPMREADMSPAYQRHLFDFPELVDKVSLAVPVAEGVCYLNLYRGREQLAFSPEEVAELDALRPALASLVRRHYGLTRPTRLTAGPAEARALAALSERERALCLHLLRGHSLKSAARTLDIAPSTAETYRKRAYAKLGVSSKDGLVALCSR
ncbi:helix-turn-helix transcriptional regulator [Halomonas sp. EF61]|uniref:helix-turn-helix transcriptional regulator n=1 Tax=Halomonas sp. EF61 TaxID=2950869 RepID=UPI0032DE5C92